ncbi:MAG: histidine kinase dimerization/phospho-acceptor domain-containing protein [Fusobacteriaceae bacterium]
MSSKKKRVSFFGKIFLFSSLIVVFTLLISYFANVAFIDRFYLYRKKNMMLNITEKIKKYSTEKSEEELDEYIYQARELEGIEIALDKKAMRMGNPMMMSRHMSMNIKIPLGEFSQKKLPGVGALILYYGEKLPDGRNIYLSTSLSVMTAHKHESNLFNLITGFFSLIFSMVAGAFFSKKITGDIALLSQKADKISRMEFSGSVEIDRNDEIGDLSRSLEKMSQSLSVSVENLKSFVSTASHELRTPISIIITHTTALLEGKIKEKNEIRRYNSIILREILEMKELTENLLTISKLDSPNYGVKKEQLNLMEVINYSREKYDFLEMEKDLQIEEEIEEEQVNYDIKLLKLAFDNIIQNAFRYSPYRGKIEIFQVDQELIIRNEMEGENGVDIETIFQPFSRGKNALDMGVDGMGLGLSIIKKSLELNGIPFKVLADKSFFTVKLKIWNKIKL